MHDPYFDVITWEIRGFDLGDDASLLADLTSRRSADPGSLDGDQWLLLGVLLLRAGEGNAAAAAFTGASQREHAPSLSRYLLAQLAMDDGRIDEAAEHLRAARAAIVSDASVPQAELQHAEGTLKLLRGDLPGAVEEYRKALELDARRGGAWRRLGEALARMGQFEAARDALLRSLQEEPDEVATLLDIAAVAVRLERHQDAADWLEKAIERDPGLRARAREDPRLADAASNPVIAPLLRDPPAPDPSWLEAFPAWLQDLRRDEATGDLGIVWLSRDASVDLARRLSDAYERGPAGTAHSAATLAFAREQLQSRKPVARGPSCRTRDGREEATILFIDVHKADRLYLALAETYPPFFWSDVGTEASRIRAALEPFFPRPDCARATMPRRVRGFLGYRGRFGVPSPYRRDVEPADVMDLERHLATSPYLEAGSWGGAFLDDPWPDEIPAQPAFLAKLADRQRAMHEQADGGIWSSTRRTRHSRSYLTIELHPGDVFVAEVRYAPAPTEALVEAFNDHFKTGYPTDLPVDALSSLLGFPFDSADDIQTRLEATSEADEIAGLLWVLASLKYGDLGVVRCFRRYMDHPEKVVRSTLCNLFAAYNYESLLEEMCGSEPDPETRASIEAVLDGGLPSPAVDPLPPSEETS
jgi:tetratricopeptide (TPR) repeat protein